MAATFRALLATKDGDRQSVAVTELTEADLMDGEALAISSTIGAEIGATIIHDAFGPSITSSIG